MVQSWEARATLSVHTPLSGLEVNYSGSLVHSSREILLIENVKGCDSLDELAGINPALSGRINLGPNGRSRNVPIS